MLPFFIARKKGTNMTGRGKPKIQVPAEPAPSPQPIPGREEEEAKKRVRVRARRTGRESTILAGRLMSRQGDILKTRLG